MHSNNPFFHRGPIRDARYFWDRAGELDQARLLVSQGQSVSIVGPRRIGKSSFLFQLARITQGDGQAWRCVYFDCEGWSTATVEELYGALAASLAGPERRSGDAAHGPSTEPLSYRAFRDAVFNEIAPEQRLVWLLDEFEALAFNPHLTAAFFSGLRALSTTGHVTFVTASARSLGWLTFTEPSVLSSPFFNIFTQINLYPFSVASAAAMLRHLAQLSGEHVAERAIDFILSLAGPHPFFAQIAAYYVYSHRIPETGDLPAQAQQTVRAEFLIQVEPHWRYAWLEVSPADRKELALMLGASSLPPELASRLRGLGLAVVDSGGWRLLSPELQSFLARQPVAGLVQAPPVLIDVSRRCVYLDGQLVEISGLEYELLLLLVNASTTMLEQETLQELLWPLDTEDVDNRERFKSVIKSLRRKLGRHGHLIQNVRGAGYSFAGSRINHPDE